jgi:hypothetical protein
VLSVSSAKKTRAFSVSSPPAYITKMPEGHVLDESLPHALFRMPSNGNSICDETSVSALRNRRSRFVDEPSSSKICRASASLIDIETGTLECKTCTVEAVAPEQQAPMAVQKRWLLRISSVLKKEPSRGNELASPSPLPLDTRQYRLKKNTVSRPVPVIVVSD